MLAVHHGYILSLDKENSCMEEVLVLVQLPYHTMLSFPFQDSGSIPPEAFVK